MKIRLLVGFLALTMLVSLFSFSALALEGNAIEGGAAPGGLIRGYGTGESGGGTDLGR